MRYAIFLLFFATSIGTSEWRTDLDSLLQSGKGPVRDALLAEILSASPDWRQVASHIESLRFADMQKGIVLRTAACDDGVERPWVLFVPANYEPSVPTPLLVILHGGVSRKDLIEDPESWVENNPFTAFAEENDWLALYPLGQEGATWWDEVGMQNIRNLVRQVKTHYNVDDDRVWMAGFSDGGSAAFLHAMVAPTDYAAFVALNGHLGVGSLDGGLMTYAPNFLNTPLYAVTTDRDRLYPSHKMRPLIDMARAAGADILYREHEGEHEFSYADEEFPLIARFLERHARDPLPTKIVWETGEARFGECRWFAIDRVTTVTPAQWHIDYNVAFVDDAVVIGFFADDSFEGPGVKVGKIFEGTAAENCGMEPGDIIVGGGRKRIKTMEDLDDFKGDLERGEAIELAVMREDEEIVLKGRIPEPENYYVFKREKPSGLARVSLSANCVDIETSRVGAFRVLVHPDLIQLEQNLVVRVNGDTLFSERVKPDLAFLLENFLENRDRRLLYVAEVSLAL